VHQRPAQSGPTGGATARNRVAATRDGRGQEVGATAAALVVDAWRVYTKHLDTVTFYSYAIRVSYRN